VGGQSALLAKPIPGRPTKLSADEMSWIAKNVKDHTPQQFKFEFGLWTLNIIRSLIKHHLKRDFSISSVHRIMKTLGFSAQKPLYQAWRQDATLVRTWESETFPAIRAQAKKESATIFFADESGLRFDYHRCTTWSPQGQPPMLQRTGRRFSINMIAAVSPRGDFRFMLHEGSVDAKIFLNFLKRLMIRATRMVIVILDGQQTHKAAMITKYVEQCNGML
jgi:transposase